MKKLFSCSLLLLLSLTFTAKGDFFEILGVSRSASPDQIKKAYRKLAMDLHPDRHSDERKACLSKKFTDVLEAYEVLSNARLCRIYLRALRDCGEAKAKRVVNIERARRLKRNTEREEVERKAQAQEAQRREEARRRAEKVGAQKREELERLKQLVRSMRGEIKTFKRTIMRKNLELKTERETSIKLGFQIMRLQCRNKTIARGKHNLKVRIKGLTEENETLRANIRAKIREISEVAKMFEVVNFKLRRIEKGQRALIDERDSAKKAAFSLVEEKNKKIEELEVALQKAENQIFKLRSAAVEREEIERLEMARHGRAAKKNAAQIFSEFEAKIREFEEQNANLRSKVSEQEEEKAALAEELVELRDKLTVRGELA